MQSYYYHKLWAELLISNEKGPLFNRFEVMFLRWRAWDQNSDADFFEGVLLRRGEKAAGEEVKQGKKGEQEEKRQ